MRKRSGLRGRGGLLALLALLCLVCAGRPAAAMERDGSAAEETLVGAGTDIPLRGIALSSEALTLTEGKRTSLVVLYTPANASAEHRAVEWSSSDEEVATVSSGGSVLACGAGTAQIMCRSADGALSASCAVTVRAPQIQVSRVTLGKSSVRLMTGEELALKARIYPAAATERTLLWESTDPSVVRVDGSGLLRALRAGTAEVLVRTPDGGAADSCAVQVSDPVIRVESVTLPQETMELATGSSAQLKAAVLPQNATNHSVTWSSSGSTVVSVDGTGKLSALRAGTATITARCDGKSAKCRVTVKNPVISVRGLSLSKQSVSLVEGEQLSLQALTDPVNATNKKVTWSSSDSRVASVTSKGLVRAKKAGTAEIAAVSADGGHSASCAVRVSAKPLPLTGLSLSRSTLTLEQGESSQLKARLTPAKTTERAVRWSSSDSAVASVDSSGLVRAGKPGTARITATGGDGKKSASCAVTVKYPAVTSITLSRESAALETGASLALQATVLPQSAAAQGISWRVSGSALSVDETGRVRALRAGRGTVTAKCGKKSARCKITVKDPVIPLRGVRLDRRSVVLAKGASLQLAASPVPENAQAKKLHWAVADGKIARVTQKGKLTARQVGTTTVTVTSEEGGYRASCALTVLFSDLVPAPAWKQQAALWAVKSGVSAGSSGSTFSPDAPCTREQMLTFLYRRAGSPAVRSEKLPFTDVRGSASYKKAIVWALQRGITTGVSRTRFGVGQSCTRAQVCAFLYRFAGSPAVSGRSTFVDLTASWQRAPVSWAARQGITSGVGGGRFAPNAACTRIQAIAMLSRMK